MTDEYGAWLSIGMDWITILCMGWNMKDIIYDFV